MSVVSPLRRVAALGVLAIASTVPAATAHAQMSAISTLFGTGVGANGGVLANGATDTHYAAYGWSSVGTVGALLGQAQTLDNGYQPTGAWQTYAYAAGTRWIWNTAAGDLGAHPSFQTVFRTTFDLAGFNAATARISGMFAGDNAIDAVYLNGRLVSNAATSSYAAFTNFAVTSGFVGGVNTLDFYARDSGAPGGVNIAMSGTALRTATITTPEPGTVALVGAGLAGVGMAARRRARRRERGR